MSQDDPFKNFSRKIPKGDDHERLVCNSCDFIHYENPRIVAGCVITKGDHFLLARRAIEPRKGKWTAPAGFMELNETPEEGAAREAFEEAKAKVKVGPLIGIYTVRHISLVHMFYHAELIGDDFGVGQESLDVQLFRWSEIPWKFLSFPTVKWALEDYAKVAGSKNFSPSVRTSEMNILE